MAWTRSGFTSSMNARSLGADATTVQTISEFKQALQDARKNTKTMVIVVKTEREVRVPGYDSWWDVAVAEASTMEDVKKARAEYEKALGQAGEEAQQECPRCTPEQVKALVQDYAQSYEHPEEVVKWHYSDPSRLHEASSLAMEDNVVAWVAGNAKVVDKPADFKELMGADR